MRNTFAAIVGVLLCSLASAQTVLIPNRSFEEGGEKPDGWTLSGGGKWLAEGGGEGRRAIVASGNGKGSSQWQSGPLELEKNAVYRLKFLAKRISGSGTAITGPPFCNRDISSLSDQWTAYESIFVTPANLDRSQARLRFGQWEMNGAVAFDGVELCRAVAVNSQEGPLELGEGELMSPRKNDHEYTFTMPMRQDSRNFSRPLVEYTCGVNTDRWVFTAGSHLIYRHRVLASLQDEAAVTVSVTYHVAGELIVEYSEDQRTWERLGAIGKVQTATFRLPEAAQRRREVFIRLRAAGVGAKSQANLQVGAYSYRSILALGPGEQCFAFVPRAGWTRFFAIHAEDPRVKVEIKSFGRLMLVPGGANVIDGTIARTGDRNVQVRPTLTVSSPGRPPTTSSMELGANAQGTPFGLPFTIPGSGPITLTFSLGPDSPYSATASFVVHRLHDTSYGQRLPSSSDVAGLWWCSSGWKVSQSRPLPAGEARSDSILIKVAANESEAAQLVIRPTKPITKFTARATELRNACGAIIPADKIEVLRVRYVNVTQPTDATGCVAPWPDPLPPFSEPISLAPDVNQPLWIRVNVPDGAVAGDYTGEVVLTGEEYRVKVPLLVHVYGFNLPDRLTCVATFALSAQEAWRYHRVTTPEDRRVVLDKYFATFGSHHISPYDPAPLDHFKVTWPKRTEEPGKMAVKFDFSAWDKEVERVLGKYHFTSFTVPVHGMGGGSFHQRYEPELHGFAEDTPQYKAMLSSYLGQLEGHLKEKDWLKYAYVYWFDEPDKKDYEFVNNGFKKLKQYAPGLNRMLTEQVETGLCGGPNIWCPVSDHYNHEKAEERRKQGEKFWWYVCCGPKAPYCTLFIDHPATELRVWLWQTWQRKIGGILVWQANYWTSPTAYPDKGHPQNPYEDPMGWVSGYGVAKGTKSPWGNGDGRFIYPPEAAADGKPAKAVLDGPVDSIRWEMLRDGLEDYEYHVILRRMIAAKSATLSARERARYEKLLEAPEQITKDMTTFTTDPVPIEARRDTIARAIEELMVRK